MIMSNKPETGFRQRKNATLNFLGFGMEYLYRMHALVYNLTYTSIFKSRRLDGSPTDNTWIAPFNWKTYKGRPEVEVRRFHFGIWNELKYNRNKNGDEEADDGWKIFTKMCQRLQTISRNSWAYKKRNEKSSRLIINILRILTLIWDKIRLNDDEDYVKEVESGDWAWL